MRNPIDSLYCCDRAEDTSCQTACKTILRTMTMENEIVDGLIEGCKKQPLPQDPLWQCFLESSRSPYPVTTVDTPPSPKLLCCSKANTTVCRDLCSKLYSTSWGSTQSWQEFESLCEYKPVEVSMLTCLADVQEPCQLGCKDLSYCTNFNNRPTDLFRSCNAQSDQGAMDDMKLWEKGSIKMPFMNIPVLDIRKCRPEMWKAVACSLQIKPCHSKSRGSVICKSDCVDILKHCGDQSKFPEGTSPETICDFLSPTDDAEYCIPLERYLSLPCNCADQFVPVCAQNGRTYPSACIARCVGLQDNQFEFGSCLSKDPCSPNNCPKGQRCLPKQKVCLTSIDDYTCNQYECVPKPTNCEKVAEDPVCDTDNVEHPNLCELYQRGKWLAYNGQCQDMCKPEKPVCGHNGETYSSVCAAYSDRVAVDYLGHCHAVGVVSDSGTHTACAAITCPPLSASGCIPVIPPDLPFT
ncbi:Reversion-inducing cysteine-rich protein with Kazal motifs [Acipenser ruthenus]|uniref:Reversion-inducing cysteine-rich protein with Kazal motifs n=1 Tax=Acipenser ruthenus TaxID=7906 RepID=A0A662YTE0_ACIRT|nr:Reversion-inducing cysteine-rich protein with Kazal motifs [Acipenser ruthenus]